MGATGAITDVAGIRVGHVQKSGGGWLSGRYRVGQELPSSTRRDRVWRRYDMSLPENQRKHFVYSMSIHGIGKSAQERTDMAFELLNKVGLPEVSFYKYPHEFSGGQRQRIAIARCLTMRPDILICDESVSALDVSVQAQVLNLLQDLQDEYKLSYIFISHDLAVVKYISDQVMVMNDGEIVEIANSDDIYRHPKMPYTQRLLSSIPRGWRGERTRAAD